MIDPAKIVKCRSVLVSTALKRDRIAYSILANLLGVANQSVGKYLTPIYVEETAKGRPDLTLVAVYSGTKYGNYNSQGKAPQSQTFDPQNPEHVKAYEAELTRVYAYDWK